MTCVEFDGRVSTYYQDEYISKGSTCKVGVDSNRNQRTTS